MEFKLMCNTKVDGKRSGRNSKISKSIVEACATDNVHIAHAFGENEEYNCFRESNSVKVGDLAHMYYGDIRNGNAIHYRGIVTHPYERLSDSVWCFASEWNSGFYHVKQVWPKGFKGKELIFCRVRWEEVPMTEEDEKMLKHPEYNGFKKQGTILRIR